MKKNIKVILILLIIIIAISITITFLIINSKKTETNNNNNNEEIEQAVEEEFNVIPTISELPEEEPSPEPTPMPTPLEPTYKGYNIAGKITIPKTGVNTPVLENVTVSGMEVAPCVLLQTGEINKSGNTYIVGHNYRNGTLFSDNNKLVKGDKIIITALDGTEKEYTIYDKFITTAEDTSFLKRELDGAEITLQSCTDDDENRIIILAK